MDGLNTGMQIAEFREGGRNRPTESDDTPTIVTGVTLRGIGNRQRVVIDLTTFRRSQTIATLAAFFGIQVHRLLRHLLNDRANRHVIVPLYRSLGVQLDTRFQPRISTAAARRRLQAWSRRTQNIGRISGNRTWVESGPEYHGWDLQNAEIERPIVLPVTSGFRQRLTRLEAEERQRRADRARYERQQRMRPVLDRLHRRRREMFNATWALRDAALAVKNGLSGPTRELAIVSALDGMLGLMIHQPTENAHNPPRLIRGSPALSRRYRVVRERQATELKRRVHHLKTLSQRHFIAQPVFGGNLVQTRERLARQLMRLLEDDAFQRDVRELAANVDIVHPSSVEIIAEGMAVAVRALVGTAQMERLYSRHLRPLMQALAAMDLDLSWLDENDRSAIAQALRAQPVTPNTTSAIVQIGLLAAGIGPQAVGNVPGPHSLLLASFEAFAVAVSALHQGRALQAEMPRLLRAIIRVAGLSGDDAAALKVAIQSRDMASIRRAPWARSFMGGKGFGIFVAVCSIITIAYALVDDDMETLDRIANIVSGATGTALGLSLAVRSVKEALEKGALTTLELNYGQLIGMVGSLIVMAVSVKNMIGSIGNNDTVGAVIHGASAAGALASAGGFLISAGLFADATILGAPAGTVLMIVGGILMIGSAIWSTVRSLLRSGVEVLFEAFIDHFGREGSHYRRVAALKPDLRRAYRAVTRHYRGVDFWSIHRDATPQLHDLGFSVAQISDLTWYKERVIRRRLRAARRSSEEGIYTFSERNFLDAVPVC